MARKREVSLFPRGKKKWISFFDVNGDFTRKSLNTSDEKTGGTYKLEMERLIALALPYGDVKLASIDPFIYEMYYKDEFLYFSSEKDAIEIDDRQEKTIMNLSNKLRISEQASIDPVSGKTWKEKYEILAASIDAQRIQAADRLPETSKVLEHYAESVKDLHKGGVNYINLITKFLTFIEFDHSKKISSITSFQIIQYLQKDIEGNRDKNKRWNKTRISFTKFFNWSCSQWGFLNPVDTIAAKSGKAQEDIVWHSLKEIEDTIKKKDDYWSSIIGLMAFAGLSAHELRGLKTSDIYIDKEVYKVRISPNEYRSLKSANRKRSVILHTAHLLPILKNYLSSKISSDVLFLPRVATKKDIWSTDTFSRHLCGAYKDDDDRTTVIGVLPSGMNALSLRRTFGSLLIRSGKTEVEVAAAMGNSPEMVRKHYARILGDEVTMDF